jgi:tight adherence protein C
MVQTLLANLPAATGALVLLAAIALILGGMAPIGYGARVTEAELARRMRFIQPLSRAVQAAEKSVASASLVRVHSTGLAPGYQREIVRRFGRFGIPETRARSAFLILRLLFVPLLGVSFLLAARNFAPFGSSWPLTMLTAAAGGIAGWFLPMTVLRSFVNEHVRIVVSGLPDALELLVMCVEAGLSFEESLARVVKELKVSHPGLAEELALTAADLKILPSREQAFGNLAARVDVPSVRSIVTTLSQTMRYGTPLANALRVVASELRSDTLITMEDRANRLPALLTVPMMLFIMPTIFLIVGGPAALRVIDTVMK